MSIGGISKRHFARLVKAEKEKLLRRINSYDGEIFSDCLMPKPTIPNANFDILPHPSEGGTEKKMETEEGPIKIEDEDDSNSNTDNISEASLDSRCCCYNKLLEQIADLKSTFARQTQILATTLAANTALLQRLVGDTAEDLELRDKFPIQTDADLLEINANINEENESQYVTEICKIIKYRGIVKMFDRILSPNVLLEYNYEGTQNKKCFRNLNNIYEVIRKAYEKENQDGEDFPNVIRRAFKICKNRHFKAKCDNNKRLGIKPAQSEFFKRKV